MGVKYIALLLSFARKQGPIFGIDNYQYHRKLKKKKKKHKILILKGKQECSLTRIRKFLSCLIAILITPREI